MDYRDLHAMTRRQGELALERHARNDFLVRDEPETVVFAANKPQHDPSSEMLTIGGVTYPRWQWAECVEIFQCPTETELAVIQHNGWQVSENSIWRIMLCENQDPNRMITINGRTMPASYHCGVRNGQPNPNQEDEYRNAGFSITLSNSWFICEPRENGGYYE